MIQEEPPPSAPVQVKGVYAGGRRDERTRGRTGPPRLLFSGVRHYRVIRSSYHAQAMEITVIIFKEFYYVRLLEKRRNCILCGYWPWVHFLYSENFEVCLCAQKEMSVFMKNAFVCLSEANGQGGSLIAILGPKKDINIIVMS